jgi:hypothetical protein
MTVEGRRRVPPDTEPKDLVTSLSFMHGPMLAACCFPGCSTLTMGGTCVEHDVPVDVVFPRGRPYVPVVRQEELAAAAPH